MTAARLYVGASFLLVVLIACACGANLMASDTFHSTNPDDSPDINDPGNTDYSRLTPTVTASGHVSVRRASGFRFPGVNIPQGSTIDFARMTMTVFDTGLTAYLTIWGYDVDDAPSFVGPLGDSDTPVDRYSDLTSVQVDWEVQYPPATPPANRQDHVSPHLESIMQEIIDRPNYAEDGLCFIFQPRSALPPKWSGALHIASDGVKGADAGPYLLVEWTPPAAAGRRRGIGGAYKRSRQSVTG